MRKKRKVEIDRNVYEAIVFASLTEGGVDRGRFFDHEADYPFQRIPVCVYGMLMHAGIAELGDGLWHITAYLGGVPPREFDSAVSRVRRKMGLGRKDRVPVVKVFEEVGIVPKDK